MVLEMQGEFTAEFTKVFKDTVEKTFNEAVTGIVLDMTNISFIDSHSLETLVNLRDTCQEKICQLKIVGLDDNCRKILEITRLQTRFDIYEELSEAVKSFV